jgi:predicted nucleic acid-binding Zn ribbon protein
MKRVIKHQKKMKNTMYIVFGVFALALFAITRANPSYASD